jgi:hypothetical protein
MLTQNPAPLPRPRSHQWLKWTTLLLGGLLFLSPYILWIGFSVVQAASVLESPNAFSWTLALFSLPQIVFSATWLYLLSMLLVAGLSLATWRHTAPRRVTRVLLILILLAMAGLPWFYRYEPAVVAASGHELRWPTQPDLLNGVARRAQVSLEQRPCTYTLAGWNKDSQLYYTSRCESADVQVWIFSPETQAAAQPVNDLPSDLSGDTRPQSQVLEYVKSPGVYPSEGEPMTRAVVVPGDGLAAPAGKWIALIARHIYGPEDVLIVSTE